MPTGPPVMVRREALWCATLSSDTLAKMPEPEDELEDDPKDEPDTLYFRREDGCTARSC